MEAKLIEKENKTQIKLNNKQEKFLIEQLQFLGSKPVKKSSRYTYFEFNGDIATTMKYLGMNN